MPFWLKRKKEVVTRSAAAGCRSPARKHGVAARLAVVAAVMMGVQTAVLVGDRDRGGEEIKRKGAASMAVREEGLAGNDGGRGWEPSRP